MSFDTQLGSPRMSYHPRPLSWIVVLVGALAIFLIYASFVLVSSPIGAHVHGYFYGIDGSEKLDVSVSSVDAGSVDKSLDVDGKKPSFDQQIDASSNSRVDDSKSSFVKLPVKEDVNETSGNSLDAANTRLPAQTNSQVGSASSATIPVEVGTDASNLTGSVRSEESASTVSINQSSAVFTTSNETSVTSDNSTSTAVPESVEKPDKASDVGSVNSGYNCNFFHLH